jgi:hypothetical protein
MARTNSSALRFATETFVEFIDLTSSIKNLLLAGIKRVAFRADIDSHLVFAIGRASSKRIAAAAFNTNFVVIWMSISFHVYPASEKVKSANVNALTGRYSSDRSG